MSTHSVVFGGGPSIPLSIARSSVIPATVVTTTHANVIINDALMICFAFFIFLYLENHVCYSLKQPVILWINTTRYRMQAW